MDYSELEASAENEMSEAILSEFLKPELPAPITLLRHCERYTVRIFDAQAERLFDKGPRPDDYWRCLRNVMENLLVYFFGCPYEPPGAAHITRRSLGDKQAMIGGTRVAPGCPWGRCIEYAMLARVDHGPEPRPSENGILSTYLHINGHIFLSY